jgi:hypothetical protein
MSVWAIHEGDCIDVMRTLAPESIDAVITSPPYAMQRKTTYGGVPEADYPAWTVAWMREVRRVLKADGNVVINIRPHIRNGQISDYTLHTRLALREDGWNEVDELIWHKPDGMPTGSPRKPRRSWESLHWFAKHGQPFSDAKAIGSPTRFRNNLRSSAARRARARPVHAVSERAVARVGTSSKVPDCPRRVDRQAHLSTRRHDPRSFQRVRLHRCRSHPQRLLLHRHRRSTRVRRDE